METPKDGDLSPSENKSSDAGDLSPSGDKSSTDGGISPSEIIPGNPGDLSSPTVSLTTTAGGGLPPAVKPPHVPEPGDEDYEDDRMLRMTFLEHLEELRGRIIKALYGFLVAFFACIVLANQLWTIVSAPAVDALHKIGANPAKLVINEPMEGFSIIWVQVPLVISLFVASPWVLYQVWAFIAPGLYRHERKWAVPFVLSTAGLFIMGGLFAYFVAFRFGLAFLLGLGMTGDVIPLVTITHYFDLFTNVMLGVSLVFELPVVIFFLTLLHIASPKFLMDHSRYAILGIVILAAIITPTPDFFNLMLFAVPMCMLFFVGVFASYLLVLHREGKKFPWGKVIAAVVAGLLILAALTFWVLTKFMHYHFVQHWPLFVK